MADTPETLATITNAMSQNFRPRVVRTFNARAQLLRMLPIVAGEGKNIAFDAEFNDSGSIAEAFADGADVANYGSDVHLPATLGWALYRSNFSVTDLARSVARTSRSPDGMLRLMARNFENSIRKLAAYLNSEAYVGPGTGNRMLGLDGQLVDTGTILGIDKSTYAGWRAKVIDPGSLTSPTLALVRDDISAVYDACGESPDIGMCSTAVWNKLASLFQENRRFTQDVQTSRGQIRLDGSAGAIEIDGCVFVKDKDATANRIYYLNSNYVRFEYLPQQDEGDMIPEAAAMVDLDDGYGAFPLGMKTYPIARVGARRKVSTQVFLNLVVEKPNACGIRKNVATT